MNSPTYQAAIVDSTRIAKHRQAVLECFAQSSIGHPDLKCYAVVDIGQHPRIRTRLANLPITLRANLFAGLPEESLDELAPCMLQIANSPDALAASTGPALHALCELTYAHPCVSWFFSSLELEALAAHLRHWFNGMLLEDDGSELGAVLVRYYDARTLPGFLAMLTPAQHAEFMQPITACGLWTRFNTWKQWLPEGDALVFPGAIPRYTLTQQEKLASMTRTDKLHAMLVEQYGPEAPPTEMGTAIAEQYLCLPQDERYCTLHRLRGRAESQGLTEEADLFMFISLALGIHMKFDSQPDFKAAIQSIATSGTSLDQALQNIPEHAWQALEPLPAPSLG